MSIAPKKLAILVGGGPAPGINSVIGAATIRAAVEGIEVIGVKDGFKWIMEGEFISAEDHILAYQGQILRWISRCLKIPLPLCCG